jgi:hypothetical protein
LDAESNVLSSTSIRPQNCIGADLGRIKNALRHCHLTEAFTGPADAPARARPNLAPFLLIVVAVSTARGRAATAMRRESRAAAVSRARGTPLKYFDRCRRHCLGVKRIAVDARRLPWFQRRILISLAELRRASELPIGAPRRWRQTWPSLEDG